MDLIQGRCSIGGSDGPPEWKTGFLATSGPEIGNRDQRRNGCHFGERRLLVITINSQGRRHSQCAPG